MEKMCIAERELFSERFEIPKEGDKFITLRDMPITVIYHYSGKRGSDSTKTTFPANEEVIIHSNVDGMLVSCKAASLEMERNLVSTSRLFSEGYSGYAFYVRLSIFAKNWTKAAS